ncbi:protein abrupt isoform X13 [Procambarus clarkii]|uniref:protein abrupt isoform X13 n=1 Tax=Procambarus clarkii TaxID=6728 RepID=UPI003742C6FF
MGADQQFCLRWNNFHTNITSAFESLRDDEDFVDITLACEGRQIKAHKMVLSACSPYFRSLLKGNPCQHPIVFLKDVTFANLTSILDFMYHGEVNVSHNELATFLKTAEALKVRGLAEDEKKKDAENYNESSSPPPPRDPPDPGSPRPEEGSSAPDTHLSDSPPPKRQRRRSGASLHSAEDTNETVLSEARDSSVKNEPQDFNEEEDMLSQSVEQDLIKTDIDDSEERSFGPSESVTISRSQAAMQQLQESFGSFLPGMGQSPGFLPQGATDMPRPPPYPLEGVQGLPPGISALPGPSMSQGAASQDASQGSVGSTISLAPLIHDGGRDGCGDNSDLDCVGLWQPGIAAAPTCWPKPHGSKFVCELCGKEFTRRYSVKVHQRDSHFTGPDAVFKCRECGRSAATQKALKMHMHRYHRSIQL